MKRQILAVILAGLLSPAFASIAVDQANDSEVASWNFVVYLNDKKVGSHQFRVIDTNGVKQVESEASFNYKILFISAYRYEHRADERWTDNCLTEFDASTNANGDRVEVSGKQTDAGFVVESSDDPAALPACVMTFAYWNPVFLDQPRLLNPQTGKYMDVSVETVGTETFEVRGQQVDATRFKLTADQIDVTLWYSSNNEWLGLESVAKGGHIIRYELS